MAKKQSGLLLLIRILVVCIILVFKDLEVNIAAQLKSFVQLNSQPAFGHLTGQQVKLMADDLASLSSDVNIICILLLDGQSAKSKGLASHFK